MFDNSKLEVIGVGSRTLGIRWVIVSFVNNSNLIINGSNEIEEAEVDGKTAIFDSKLTIVDQVAEYFYPDGVVEVRSIGIGWDWSGIIWQYMKISFISFVLYVFILQNVGDGSRFD